MPSVSNYDRKVSLPSRQLSVSAASAVLATLLLSSGAALAVDVDAGDYTALPAGTNLAMAYYQYATRDALYSDGDKAPIDAGVRLTHRNSSRNSLH